MTDTVVSLGTAAARVVRGLTEKQRAARKGKFTASVGPRALMTGDKTAIMNLWRELTGDPTYVPEDLSGVWRVQLGCVTESLNLDWIERRIGEQVIDRGVFIQHPRLPWAGATIDGMLRETERLCEAKHVGGWESIEAIVDRTQPQAQWQMACAPWKPKECILSVIMGAREPLIEIIPRCDEYIGEMVRRATDFWRCVETRTPPVELPPAAPPVPAVKTYSMEGNNMWADMASTWLDTRITRNVNELAEKELKALVPADAKLCHGHGVRVTRNRAGNLSLREGSL